MSLKDTYCALETLSTTIAASGSLSDTINCYGLRPFGIVVPSDWTTANLTFQLSADGGTTWSNMQDQNGNEIVAIATASNYIALNPVPFATAQYLRVRSGTAYTASLYLKAGTATAAQLTMGSTRFPAATYANFDLVNGVLGNVSSGVTATITYAGNEWYRCSITATASSTGTTSGMYIALTNSNVNASKVPSYVGSAQYLFVWGAQTEALSKATSYIPTTTVAATRAADRLSFSIPSVVKALRCVFDDQSVQDVDVSLGAYVVPTSLSRTCIRRIYNT